MVLNRQKKVRVAVAPLETFLDCVRSETRTSDAEVTVCFVSDVEMARLNAAFRRKQGPTDVLSFPAALHARAAGRRLLRKPGTLRRRRSNGSTYLGDIAIAPETARRYARRNGRRLHDELRILMLHGVLHLLGYDHETDQGEMERVERRLRRRLGLTP